MKTRPFSIFFLIFLSFSFLTLSSDYPGSGSGTERSIQNIETFARLYGYVRYFYPGDEAASLDWERFALYGVKKVESAPNEEALKKTLEELFLPVAPALAIYKSGPKAHFSAADITPPRLEGMNVVAWQHYGLGSGNPKNIYQSARLNRGVLLSSDEKAGSFSFFLDAAPFRKKIIKLRAAVKMAAGQGQLYMMEWRENRQRGFEDYMEDRPIQSSQWEYYEIKSTVAEDAVDIVFGCMLSGSGELYVDDFQVSVKKESPAEEWEPVFIENPGFEGDRDGDLPSGWISRKMRSYSLQVTSAAAAEGRKSASLKSHAPSLFERRPEIGDCIIKDLGSGLSCLMPLALYGTETHTFPQAPEEKLSRLLADIERDIPPKPEQVSGDDLYVRLADVAMAWNVFQHFYPYFDVVKTDWRAALAGALSKAYADKNRWDFLRTLRKLTAKLMDGHARVNVQGDTSEDYLLPLDWDWIEGRLVITNILSDTLSPIQRGDVVMRINGLSAEDALKEKEQYISAATAGWKRRRALGALLSGEKDKEFRLEIRRDGLIYHEKASASLSVKDYYDRLLKKATKTKELEEGITYLNLTQASQEEIDQLLPELQKARALICDLRGYPNGNHFLIKHLMKTKDRARWMGIPQVIYPDFEQVSYDKMGWSLEPSKPALSAKVVFITDASAISYAESYLGYIEGYKLATIVGQPTAGTNGNVNRLNLPGGYSLFWTGMRVVKIDGSPHHGVGIIPHVRAERTIGGVRAGRDEFLEKALEVARAALAGK